MRLILLILSFNLFAQTNVKDFCAVGDGITNDLPAINNAVLSLSDNSTLYFPPGKYMISGDIAISNLSNLKVKGYSATIIYNSILPSGGVWLDASALNFAFCDNLTVEGLAFEGSSDVSNSSNVGVGIYLTRCKDTTVAFCNSKYGGALTWVTSGLPNDGFLMTNCRSYGAANYIMLGTESIIESSYFEQPDDPLYDSPNTTHAIYMTAGSGNALFSGNQFKNIRTVGIKISGSNSPVENVSISNNIFTECSQAILFGADDNQRHDNCSINNNKFIDCGTNRDGWDGQATVEILGSKNTSILYNEFIYTRESLIPPSGKSAIQVHQYTSGSQIVEDVRIIGNTFKNTYDPGVRAGADLVTWVIKINDVQGYCRVAGNDVVNVGQTACQITNVQSLILTDNYTWGMARFAKLVDNVTPWVNDNVVEETSTPFQQILNPPMLDTLTMGVNLGF